MSKPFLIENAFCRISDFIFEKLPQPVPNSAQIAKARVIAHRGVYDNKSVFENTLPAFEQVKADGVWGVELDVRWTRDCHPVVFHDSDCRRMFGDSAIIRELTRREVATRFPQIPSLADVIEKFGKTLHLMIELKEDFIAVDRQNQILCELFSGLSPADDFHLMSLCPENFHSVTCVPPEALIPIAETNPGRLANMALKKKYGGVAGHYLLLRDPVLRRMSADCRGVGTGFINSVNCFFREVNRGVTWVFSDRAMVLARARQWHLKQQSRQRFH